MHTILRPSRFALTWLFTIIALLLVWPIPAESQTLPGGFVRTQIAEVNAATRMAFAPDGRIFVAEISGRLRVIKNGALLSTPFVTINVAGGGSERGLTGLVLDPNFATNHYIYLYYTAPTPTIHSRVSRFTADGDVAVAGSEHVIIDLDTQTAGIHNGGAMKFWHDGTLFITTGENTTPPNAQNLGNLLGKVLRIDVRSDEFPDDPHRNYSIPSTNPFRNTSGARPEIWAYGLRNPWSMAVQRGTTRVFINDVGSNFFEEINEGQAGCNYGWPLTEGYTNDSDICSPLFAYAHATGFPHGCAIIGGAFYNPPVQRFPSQYVGKYFFADYCSWWIDVLDLTTHMASAFATGLHNMSDMDVGPDGNLYYLVIDLTTGTSTVNRISYTGSLAPQINTQPADQLAPVGYSATFTVGADGEPTLIYQWQRNGAAIQGATSASYTTPVLALSDNGATYRCLITNPFGNTTSGVAVLTVTTKQPPVPTISLPAAGTYYEAGDTIGFSGSAVDGHDIVTHDPQDGVLGPSAFTWQALFEHHSLNNPEHHTHPFFPPTSGIAIGSFEIPTSGETDPDVWYRVFFTARDSYGLSTTVFRDIFPYHVQMKVTTSPVLFPVEVDGSPKSAPYPFWNVVNLTRSIGVDTPQVVNGLTYDFVSWSDGGARSHNVSAPQTATGYVANFLKRPGYGSITANPNPIRVNDGSGKGATTLYWSSGQTNTVEVRLGAPGGQLIARSGAGSFSQITNKSIGDGTKVYLQDVSDNQPLTRAYTLDTATLRVTTAPTGSIIANPNPFVTDSNGDGQTTLAWTSYGTSAVELRVNAPDGNKFASSGPGSFSASTGRWVRDGMTVYLQDVSGGLPLTAANTLAKVRVNPTAATPSGSIRANPNPFTPNAQGLGQTAITWTSTGTSRVEVHVNTPDGNRLEDSGPGTFTVNTGQWVRDGMKFYLQNVSDGLPLTSANTLDTVTAVVTP
jgi:glucose/arabinose dehydrogenase